MAFLKALFSLLFALPFLCCCTAMLVQGSAIMEYQKAVMTIDHHLLPENVEVVIPRERHPEGFFLSPDGRRAILDVQGSGVLLDLTDGHEVSLGSDVYVGQPVWLENDLFLAQLREALEPVIVNADDLSRTELERFTCQEEEIDQVRAVLERSRSVYGISDEGRIVALAPDFRSGGKRNYLIVCPSYREDMYSRMLDGIEYLTRRGTWKMHDNPRAGGERLDLRGRGEKLYSPNESFYVTGSSKVIAMYSRDGQLVTEFRKHDYDGVHFEFIVFGWAHDNSAVFFRIRSYSEFLLQQPSPILKLLARPAKETIPYWPFPFLFAALVAVGGGGYLVTRKRHRKAAMAVLIGGVLLLLPWVDWIARYTMNQIHYERAVRQAEKVNKAITFVGITDRLIPNPDDPEHKHLEVILTVGVQEEADYCFYSRLGFPLERRTRQGIPAGYELDIMKGRGCKRVHLGAGKQQIHFIFPYWDQQRKPNIVSDGPYVFYVSLEEISSIGGMPFRSSQEHYARAYNLLRPEALKAEFQTSAYSLSDFECPDSLCGNE